MKRKKESFLNNQPSNSAKSVPYLTAGSVPRQYPWLSEDQSCDVCVIGGGVTGALCALTLAETGRSVTLITSHEIGFGDTSALSTAVEADRGATLTELTRNMPIEKAVKLYRMGLAALDELENLCHSLDKASGAAFSTGFARRDCLLFTDDAIELELLNHEFLARKHNRFDCAFISREQARDSFSFDLCGGILGKACGATLNPYHLAHLCLMRAAELGVNIFEHTAATDIQPPPHSEGSVIVTTSTRRTIYAGKLILATGSEGLRGILSRKRRRSAALMISHPLIEESPSGWPGQCIIRTFGTPKQIYSFTPDGRISAECADSPNRLPLAENVGAALRRLSRRFDGRSDQRADQSGTLARLEESVGFLFPAIASVKTDYAFEREYVTAPDGLPLIGTHRDYNNCIFALTGGRGALIEAQWAAQTAADICEELFNEDMAAFSPMRESV